jgi:VIT1/CCC1 family predicted Fe2+/Mn2+ transporter
MGMFVAFLPCLGSLNWLNIPFSVVGLVIGIVAFVTSKEAKKGAGIAGIVMCGIAVVFGMIRLIAGGGVL